MFEQAAEELTASCDGDSRQALLKALAFISGCNKEMAPRSLLNGAEGYRTFQMDLTAGQ